MDDDLVKDMHSVIDELKEARRHGFSLSDVKVVRPIHRVKLIHRVRLVGEVPLRLVLGVDDFPRELQPLAVEHAPSFPRA